MLSLLSEALSLLVTLRVFYFTASSPSLWTYQAAAL